MFKRIGVVSVFFAAAGLTLFAVCERWASNESRAAVQQTAEEMNQAAKVSNDRRLVVNDAAQMDLAQMGNEPTAPILARLKADDAKLEAANTTYRAMMYDRSRLFADESENRFLALAAEISGITGTLLLILGVFALCWHPVSTRQAVIAAT